jgi:hypothetical protein
MGNSYHNTVPEEGELLGLYQKKAATQDENVLSVFKWNRGRGFTPAEIYTILIGWNEKILLTSVRRSITNLTKARRLVKCQRNEVRNGKYNRINRVWRYNSDYLPNLATGK